MRLGILLFSILCGFYAHALPEEIKAMTVAPIDEKVLASQPEQLGFVYNSEMVKDAPAVSVTMEDLQRQALEMSTPEYQQSLNDKVVIPVSIAAADKLEQVKTFDAKKLSFFITRKQAYLEKVVKLFSYFRARPEKVNKILGFLNTRFFENAPLVADANAIVLNFGLGGSIGIGFSDWFMDQFRKVPFLKNLPERSGFYFAVSLGFSIVRTNRDGVVKLSIEPVLDLRRATRIFSPYAFTAGGFMLSQTLENRSLNEPLVQKADFYKISSGTIFSSATQIGVSEGIAIPFPPGGGAIAGLEGKFVRYRLNSDVLKIFFQYVKQTLQPNSVGRTCRQAFLI